MKSLPHSLTVIAVIAFVFGIFVKMAAIPLFSNILPVTIWRFTMACLGFAIVAALMEIRDKLDKPGKQEEQ